MAGMGYKQIANWQTRWEKGEPLPMHESCLRSYHIVQKVKWLLEKRTHPDVVIELIALMESSDIDAAQRVSDQPK